MMAVCVVNAAPVDDERTEVGPQQALEQDGNLPVQEEE